MWHAFLFFHQKTVKLKAEARLDLLRQVGVAVDTWLKSAMNQVCLFLLVMIICIHRILLYARMCMHVPVWNMAMNPVHSVRML